MVRLNGPCQARGFSLDDLPHATELASVVSGLCTTLILQPELHRSQNVAIPNSGPFPDSTCARPNRHSD